MMTIRILLFVAFMALCPVLGAQTIMSYERPGKEEFVRAVDVVLSKTQCTASAMDERIEAMSIVQRELNNFSSQQWRDYNALTKKKKIAAWEKEGALYFYTRAMDKVLAELESTVVSQGQVVMWNLYNMGYIIKTPSHTFSVDLIHKHIDKFTKYLDFNLITHKHRDHGSLNEFEAFAKAGVPVYAGYMTSPKPDGLDWRYVKEGETITVDNITINTRRGDHYYKDEGFKMITLYEIDCGEDTGHTVIFHTGDCRNYEQFELTKPVDFFIFHTAVGLKIQKAIDKVQPKFAVFSHAWEMGHSAEKYRWTIDDLLLKSGKITGFPKDRILLPCWGEKIIYLKD